MPLRGQILFVRPITPADLSDLRTLKPELEPPVEGLLGRLVGETVCFASIATLGSGEMRIEDFFVAPDLRRKRVGRALMSEVEKLAVTLDCRTLIVSKNCDAPEFFRNMGFAEVESMLRKRV